MVPIVIAFIIYFFTKSLTPTYQSNASLIYSNDNSNIVEISEVYDQASINNQNEINTQISVLKSREILKRILNKSEKINEINNLSIPNKENIISKTLSLIGVNFFAPKKINKEALFSQLFGSMSVSQKRNSNVINVTLEANVPEQAKKALDLILATYLEYDIDQKISVTSYASDKINERLNELKVKLEDSEKILQVYKEKNKLIDLGDIKNLKSDEIQSISKRIIKAETQYKNYKIIFNKSQLQVRT